MMARSRQAAKAVVNWADIRARIEAAGKSLAGAIESTPEETRERLEERARALARPVASQEVVDRLEVVTFSLANERYALESRHVIEVFRLRELAPLPGAKPPITGLTAWRGDLLVVLDLRPLLGLASTALNDLSRVLVLGHERSSFGILADAVRDMATLDLATLRNPPEASKARDGYVRGMTPEAVLLLDGELLLHLLDTDRSRRQEGFA